MHPNIDDNPIFNTYFDDPNPTHGSSRLDYQWLSFSLLPSLYKSMTWPNNPVFYSTDHKMLSLVLDTNELFTILPKPIGHNMTSPELSLIIKRQQLKNGLYSQTIRTLSFNWINIFYFT